MISTHPFVDVEDFPTTRVRRGDTYHRIVAERHLDAPGYFGCSGANRFDLDPLDEQGVCYLADGERGALRETLLREVASPRAGRPHLLAPGDVADHQVVTIRLPRGSSKIVELADDTESFDEFGVTAADLCFADPTAVHHQWAQAFAAHGSTGIRYQLRRGEGEMGLALFGPRGDHLEDDADRRKPLTARLVDELTGGRVLVADPPAEDSADVYDEPR